MRIAQITGPFEVNDQIFPNPGGGKVWIGLPTADHYSNYIVTHIGIQVPQTPYLIEYESSNYEDLSEMSSIHGFVNNASCDFIINENEILEFDDIEKSLDKFIINAGSNLDEYTIIDIGYQEK